MNYKEQQEKNKENIRNLLTELMEFYVALDRKKIVQKRILEKFINGIKDESMTFQKIMKTLRAMMLTAKTNETKAVLGEVFNIFVKHYNNQLK